MGKLVLSVFVAALVGCALGCTIAMKLMGATVGGGEDPGKDGHEWLHDQLDLSSEQIEQLEVIERRYDATESKLEAALVSATAELGQIVEREGEFTEGVSEAVERVHAAMARLQKHTLEHLFEMKPVLSDRQYQKLLRLAGEALAMDNEEHAGDLD